METTALGSNSIGSITGSCSYSAGSSPTRKSSNSYLILCQWDHVWKKSRSCTPAWLDCIDNTAMVSGREDAPDQKPAASLLLIGYLAPGLARRNSSSNCLEKCASPSTSGLRATTATLQEI